MDRGISCVLLMIINHLIFTQLRTYWNDKKTRIDLIQYQKGVTGMYQSMLPSIIQTPSAAFPLLLYYPPGERRSPTHTASK